jgi:hypothetical protein
MHWNSDAFKYFLLLLAAPIWWPFLKALYREYDNALADEGGIWGRRKPESTEEDASAQHVHAARARRGQPPAVRPILPRRSGRL